MSPVLRWRLIISLVGFVIWAIGARAERDGAPWAKTAMTIGLVILAIAVLMRFIKREPRVDQSKEPPRP